MHITDKIENAMEAIRRIILDSATSTQDINKLECMIWELKTIRSHYPTIEELKQL